MCGREDCRASIRDACPTHATVSRVPPAADVRRSGILALVDGLQVPRKRPKRPMADSAAIHETTMLTNAGEDFSKILTDAGYRLVVRERKYMDPVVHKYAPSPATQFLFALR